MFQVDALARVAKPLKYGRRTDGSHGW